MDTKANDLTEILYEKMDVSLIKNNETKYIIRSVIIHRLMESNIILLFNYIKRIKRELEENLPSNKKSLIDNIEGILRELENILLFSYIKRIKRELEENIPSDKKLLNDDINSIKRELDENLLFDNKTLNKYIERIKWELEKNLLFDNKSLNNYFDRIKRELKKNLQFDNKSLNDSIEKILSELEEKLQSDKKLRNDNIEKILRELEKNLPSDNKSLNDYIKRIRWELEKNFQSGKKLLNDSIEEILIKLDKNFPSYNMSLNDSIEKILSELEENLPSDNKSQNDNIKNNLRNLKKNLLSDKKSLNNNIDRIMSFFIDDESPFKSFDLNRITVNDFCNFVLALRKKIKSDRRFYYNIEQSNFISDFSDIYKYFVDYSSKFKVIENIIYTSIEELLGLSNSWESDTSESEDCFTFEFGNYSKYFNKAIECFNTFSRNNYKVIDELKKLPTAFHDKMIMDSVNIAIIGGDDIKFLFQLNLYTKFVYGIVILSIFYIVNVGNTPSFNMDTRKIDDYKRMVRENKPLVCEYLKRLKKGCEEMLEMVKKEEGTIADRGDKYIRNYLFWLSKKQIFDCGKKIRDQLSEEIECELSDNTKNGQNYFDNFNGCEQIVEKYNKKRQKIDNGIIQTWILREINTLNTNTRDYDERIEALNTLFEFSTKKCRNYYVLDNISFIRYTFAEIYEIKSESPITKHNAKSIITKGNNNFSVSNEYIPDVDKEYFDKLSVYSCDAMFLDCCILRGIMTTNSKAYAFKYFSEIIDTVCETILSIINIDGDAQKLILLNKIADGYISLLHNIAVETEDDFLNEGQKKVLSDKFDVRSKW
ncbi:MAG: hypothetical protein VZR33_08125 [Methanosphaera sp.]|nr:hypothetical protein [Methanosphaera sp.]